MIRFKKWGNGKMGKKKLKLMLLGAMDKLEQIKCYTGGEKQV